MDVVRFHCAACGKPMAVVPEDLGKPVECPHCGGTVAAPPPGPPAPEPKMPPSPEADATAGPRTEVRPPATEAGAPLPEFHVPSAAEQESIFASAEETGGDDLFGEPTRVRVELPPEPPVPDLQLEPLVPHPSAEAQTVSLPAGEPQHPPPGLVVAPPPEPLPARPPAEPEPALAFTPAEEVPAPAAAAETPPPVETPRPPAGESVPGLPAAIIPRRPQGKSVFVPLLLVFLIPYAMLSTVAVVWLLFQLRARSEQQNQPPAFDPLERLPDPAREGAPRRVKHDAPLPGHLQTTLRNPLRVGDLQVTPLAVKRTPDGQLQLKLKLRNLSRDVKFDPLPDTFLRYAPDANRDRPYTFLALGPDPDQRIYGANIEHREGLDPDGTLHPGKEEVLTLSTDPDYVDLEDLLALLDRAQTPILWRVQVRRGLVRVRGKDVSATAVVGVRLDPRDLPRPPDQRLGLPTYRSLACLPDPEATRDQFRRVEHDAPLPPALKMGLKQSRQIGELLITPLTAERTADGELVLKLQLRNVSRNRTFDPLPVSLWNYDPAAADEEKPYTFLQFGPDRGERIYGIRLQERTDRPDGKLGPGGQEVVTLSAGGPKHKELLDRARGPILWRVQLRCRFVRAALDDVRRVPATAVIGVQFDPRILDPVRGEASLRPRASPAVAKKPGFL
jgi:hypothetical protein